MGKILLKNMRFFGYHGVLEEEKRLGQEFQVDVEVTLNLDQVLLTDDVQDTIDYSKFYNIAEEIVENKKYRLIESIAGDIISRIKEDYGDKIDKILVRVRKPSAPVFGIFDYAQVEIEG